MTLCHLQILVRFFAGICRLCLQILRIRKSVLWAVWKSADLVDPQIGAVEKLCCLQMFDKFADSKLRLQILNNLQINPQILQIRKPVLTHIYILVTLRLG